MATAGTAGLLGTERGDQLLVVGLFTIGTDDLGVRILN